MSEREGKRAKGVPYKPGRELGRGMYGVVTDLEEDHPEFDQKVIKTFVSNHDAYDEYMVQKFILRNVPSSIRDFVKDIRQIDSYNVLYDKVHGDQFQKTNFEDMTVDERQSIALQLAKAGRLFSDLGIDHGDAHDANLMITKDKKPVAIDWGMTKVEQLDPIEISFRNAQFTQESPWKYDPHGDLVKTKHKYHAYEPSRANAYLYGLNNDVEENISFLARDMGRGLVDKREAEEIERMNHEKAEWKAKYAAHQSMRQLARDRDAVEKRLHEERQKEVRRDWSNTKEAIASYKKEFKNKYTELG